MRIFEKTPYRLINKLSCDVSLSEKAIEKVGEPRKEQFGIVPRLEQFTVQPAEGW